jgi:ribonuclease PH
MVSGVELLDLNYDEDSSAEVDANVVMNAEGQLIELQLSSERSPLTRSQLDQLVDLASAGIEKLFQAQQKALNEASSAQKTMEPQKMEIA